MRRVDVGRRLIRVGAHDQQRIRFAPNWGEKSASEPQASRRGLRRRNIPRMKTRPVQAVDERGELRSRQPHHAVADRRPAKRALLEPLPAQDQARSVPGQNLQTVRSLRAKDENRSGERIALKLPFASAARLSAPRRKSTGFVATRTRTPAGTVITSPPSPHAALSSASRHRSRSRREPSPPRARSRSSRPYFQEERL